MNSYLTKIVTLTLLTMGVSSAHAKFVQPEENAAQVQQPELPDFQVYEISTAGFSFSFEQRKEPVIRERTDGSTYSVTVQRRAMDDKAFWTDGTMPFIRMTQSVNAVDDPDEIEEALRESIREAVRAIDRTFGKRRDRIFTDCSLQIMGELRFGKRIDVDLMPNGMFVYVECYSFQDELGNVITLTFKIREPTEDTIPRDSMWTAEILSSLQIHDLDSSSYCLQLIGGYPMRIPVTASIQGTRRVNNLVTETGIIFEHGTARIQNIRVQNNRNPYAAAREQLVGFQNAVKQQAAQGLIDVNWESEAELLGGVSQNGIVRGHANSIRSNDQPLYSTLFTAVDKRNVIVVNFIGRQNQRAFLDEYANEFFARPMSSFSRQNASLVLNSSLANLPRELRVTRNPKSELADFIFDVSNDLSWAEKIASLATSQGGHTHVREIPAELDLEQAHKAICAFYLANGDEGTTVQADPLEHSFDERTKSYSTDLVIGTEDQGLAIRITSQQASAEGSKYLVSSISSPDVAAYQLRVARAISGWISESRQGTSYNMGFGSIGSLPDSSLVTRSVISSTIEQVDVDSGIGSISVFTTELNSEQSARSNTELSSTMMRPAWNRAVTSELQSLFPEDPSDLLEHTLGDTTGRMIEAIIDGKEYVRVVGLRLDERYVTALLRSDDLEGIAELEALININDQSEDEDQP